jgi:hypothetical protein
MIQKIYEVDPPAYLEGGVFFRKEKSKTSE